MDVSVNYYSLIARISGVTTMGSEKRKKKIYWGYGKQTEMLKNYSLLNTLSQHTAFSLFKMEDPACKTAKGCSGSFA
jgi:hypothetical protein